eukprot:NODE_281_length_10828_cov_0.749837.p1 type:complete len:832 gc:universal NODE_281_length_10828_cov_0.749837:1422-3917(+)
MVSQTSDILLLVAGCYFAIKSGYDIIKDNRNHSSLFLLCLLIPVCLLLIINISTMFNIQYFWSELALLYVIFGLFIYYSIYYTCSRTSLLIKALIGFLCVFHISGFIVSVLPPLSGLQPYLEYVYEVGCSVLLELMVLVITTSRLRLFIEQKSISSRYRSTVLSLFVVVILRLFILTLYFLYKLDASTIITNGGFLVESLTCLLTTIMANQLIRVLRTLSRVLSQEQMIKKSLLRGGIGTDKNVRVRESTVDDKRIKNDKERLRQEEIKESFKHRSQIVKSEPELIEDKLKSPIKRHRDSESGSDKKINRDHSDKKINKEGSDKKLNRDESDIKTPTSPDGPKRLQGQTRNFDKYFRDSETTDDVPVSPNVKTPRKKMEFSNDFENSASLDDFDKSRSRDLQADSPPRTPVKDTGKRPSPLKEQVIPNGSSSPVSPKKETQRESSRESSKEKELTKKQPERSPEKQKKPDLNRDTSQNSNISDRSRVSTKTDQSVEEQTNKRVGESLKSVSVLNNHESQSDLKTNVRKVRSVVSVAIDDKSPLDNKQKSATPTTTDKQERPKDKPKPQPSKVDVMKPIEPTTPILQNPPTSGKRPKSKVEIVKIDGSRQELNDLSQEKLNETRDKPSNVRKEVQSVVAPGSALSPTERKKLNANITPLVIPVSNKSNIEKSPKMTNKERRSSKEAKSENHSSTDSLEEALNEFNVDRRRSSMEREKIRISAATTPTPTSAAKDKRQSLPEPKLERKKSISNSDSDNKIARSTSLEGRSRSNSNGDRHGPPLPKGGVINMQRRVTSEKELPINKIDPKRLSIVKERAISDEDLHTLRRKNYK